MCLSCAKVVRMPITRTCDKCGEPYTRPPALIGRYCSRSCWKAATRTDRPEYRRIRYMPGHPLAAANGQISEARLVLYEKIGPGPHKCHWCPAVIDWAISRKGNQDGAIMADHLDNDFHNDAPENLVPACSKCNIGRIRPATFTSELVQCERCSRSFEIRYRRSGPILCLPCKKHLSYKKRRQKSPS